MNHLLSAEIVSSGLFSNKVMWVVLDLYLCIKIESIFNIIDLGLFLMWLLGVKIVVGITS